MRKILLSMCGLAMCATLNAASIEVKEYLGYMWKAVDTVDFGEVATGESTTYYKNGKPLQVVADGVDVSAITVTCSDETVSAKIEGDENYMYLAVAPSSGGEYSQTVTLSAEGADDVVINVHADAVSLSFSTIAELKSNATKDGQRYHYVGRATVTHVEGNMIWVSDETGGTQLAAVENHGFVPGDVVSFSGVVMSPNYAWKSLSVQN